MQSQIVGELCDHDGRPYQVAKSEAAAFFRQKLQADIAQGLKSARHTVEHVLSTVPQDAIVRAGALRFEANGRLYVSAGEDRWGVHPHAVNQIAERAGVPTAYANKLLASGEDDAWKRELLAHILHTHYGHEGGDTKYLVRALPSGGKPEIRGFLSDRYRRLDSRPLMEAFITEAEKLRAVPVRGTVTDVAMNLKVLLPTVFEPIEGEIIGIGCELSNSDFGAGRLNIRSTLWRGWCSNLAAMEDTFAKVHIGRQLPDEIELSKTTYELDTAANVSAVRDITQALLAPAKVEGVMDLIRRAAEEKVDWAKVSRRLTSILTKGEQAKVRESFESDSDVSHLPAGESVWRLSNAISWLAKGAEKDERRLELERLAGEVLQPAKADVLDTTAK